MESSLSEYLQRWHLSDPEPLAQTFTSHVYLVTRNNERVVLKLLNGIGAVDEAEGAQALMCFDGRGAVRLLAYHAAHNAAHHAGAHLLEYADGESLVQMVARGGASSGADEQAARIIASVLKALHSVPECAHTDKLKPLRRWFRSLFERAAHDPDPMFTQAAQIARKLLDHPQEERVLHGDIHHENIRHSARGWLAFDPKGLFGERTYDAANTLLNPVSMPHMVMDEARLLRNARILADEAALDFERLLAFTFAYACLSASWSMEDGQDAALALSVARMLQGRV